MIDPSAFRIALWFSALVGGCGGSVVQEPGPEVILSVPTPAYLALSPGRLFVATVDPGTTNSVMSVSVAGGQRKWIANCDCSGLAVNTRYVLWTTKHGPLKRADLDGSNVITLAEMHGGASPVADEDWVYAAVQLNSGKIFRVPVQGGDAEVLAEGQYQPGSLALNATHVYWTNFGKWGAVRRMNRDGGPIEDLAANLSSPGDLHINDSHAYWVDRPDFAGRVMRVSLAGGSPEVLTMTDAPLGLAIDDRDVYWGIQRPITGMVRRLPLDGGDTLTVARDQDWPAAIVVDSDYVYWANARGGTVMRKARSAIR